MSVVQQEEPGVGNIPVLDTPASPPLSHFRHALRWLLAGTLLYAVALVAALILDSSEALLPLFSPSVYLTPLFGLPFVVAGFGRAGRWRRLVLFLLLLPLVHGIAHYLAWRHAVLTYDESDAAGQALRDLVTGAIGGVSGAGLSFLLLWLMWLVRRRTRTLALMVAAMLGLGALGAVGMAQGLALSGPPASIPADDPRPLILWFLMLYLPWQTAFSLVLAMLMRPARISIKRRGAVDGDGVGEGA